jgi:hypothetical protein
MLFRGGIVLLAFAATGLYGLDQRCVREPVIPATCSVLTAANSWPLREDSPDPVRIQNANPEAVR